MIALAAWLLTLGSTSVAPPPRVLGDGLDCKQGYYGLTRALVAAGHYLPVAGKPDRAYTSFLSVDDRSVWRFTLVGNRAHPAVAKFKQEPNGRMLLAGACGFGDGSAFETFVSDATAEMDRRARTSEVPRP